MEITQQVLDAFYSPKTGLTRNLAKLKEKNPGLWGIPRSTIKQILDQNIEIYNKNNEPVHRRETIRYRADYIGQLLHCDLAFLASPRNTAQKVLLKDEHGEDNQYLLVIVDTFSRYLWAYPLKSKAASRVTELIRSTIGFIREFFYGGYDLLRFTVLTDGGSEFSKKAIEKIKNVNHRVARVHAVLAESAIFRIRNKLKYLDDGDGPKRKLGNEDFVSIIQNLNLESGADKILEGIDPGPEPDPVKEPREPPLYTRGDRVRVRRQKQLFEKASSLSTFSDHVFLVWEALWFPQDGVWAYRILSRDGNYVSTKFWLAGDLSPVPRSLEVPFKDFTKDEIKLYFLKP